MPKPFSKPKEGSTVEGFWPEPLEIKKIEEFGEYVRIVGATIYSNEHFDQVLSKEDLKRLKISEFSLNFSTSGPEAFLTLEGERYKLASLFDPLLAMNISKIEYRSFI